jgi:hypothetical protein
MLYKKLESCVVSCPCLFGHNYQTELIHFCVVTRKCEIFTVTYTKLHYLIFLILILIFKVWPEGFLTLLFWDFLSTLWNVSLNTIICLLGKKSNNIL